MTPAIEDHWVGAIGHRGRLVALLVVSFTIGLAPTVPPPGYFVFQHCFTLPDILALAFVKAGTLLLSDAEARRELGCDLSLICSRALLFLGLLDVCFNLQSGIYATTSIDTVLEIVINVWCIGLSSLLAFEQMQCLDTTACRSWTIHVDSARHAKDDGDANASTASTSKLGHGLT